MTANNQDWDIRARGETCSACGKPFADQEEFNSRLTYGEDGYVRQDFCTTCWAGAQAEPSLSSWKSVFRLPPPPPEEPLKKETVESLLRKLMENEDAADLNTIFILAVMLERRRVFVEQDVQIREDGTRIRVYEHRKTNETFLIRDPELKLSELQHVQAEVVARLGGNDPKPEPAPPADPSDQTVPT